MADDRRRCASTAPGIGIRLLHPRRVGALGLIAVLTVMGCSAGDAAPESVDAPAADDEPTDDGVDDPVSQPGDEPETEPESEPLEPLEGLSLEVVADGLAEPIGAAALPDGRLLVVERAGRIRLVTDGDVADQPYLDLTGVVSVNSIEQGLLGLALHPRFPDDPRAFVFHSLPDNDNVLASYRLRDGGDGLDPASREELFVVDKESDKVRHNGGQIVFGPDGRLFVSLGDAARASINGQDASTLPGSIVRIDVDGAAPYEVPADNPFADGVDGAPEVWWFGLRNPWRFSIDEPTGLAYIADVGQETVEEVNVVPYDEGGHNFGWPSFEGTVRFYDSDPASPVTAPVFESQHDDTDRACSITGGMVYRGAAIPELDGHYLYADWCRGWIRSFRYDDGEVLDEADWSEQLDAEMVASFALDGDGEMLVVDTARGDVTRIVARRAGA